MLCVEKRWPLRLDGARRAISQGDAFTRYRAANSTARGVCREAVRIYCIRVKLGSIFIDRFGVLVRLHLVRLVRHLGYDGRLLIRRGRHGMGNVRRRRSTSLRLTSAWHNWVRDVLLGGVWLIIGCCWYMNGTRVGVPAYGGCLI